MATRTASSPVSAKADFDQAFDALKRIFSAYESRSIVLHDEPGKYYLASHKVRPKDGYRLWLGGAEIKKSYVSAHVFPVYMYPDLLKGASPALLKHMQGKACFNFKKPDDALFDELSALLEAGHERLENEP